jgi:predicted transcriptional regulator of viral defense system
MKKANLDNLNNLMLFTKESLRQWEKDEDSLNFNIKYWSNNGLIIPLKKGKYILKSRFEKEENKDLYLEYLANKIYEPSYISGEYIMSKYNLLTEAVYGISSVTTKKTKSFDNKLGKFNYYSLSPRLFFGYESVKFYSASIMVAKKSKAVLDYLYLRFCKNALISEKAIEELRINWENLNKNEFLELEKYAIIANNKRTLKVISLIKKKYYD